MQTPTGTIKADDWDTHRIVRMMFSQKWNSQPTARNTPSGGCRMLTMRQQ